MNSKKIASSWFALCVFILLSSCHRTTYETIYPTLSDGKYDSEFPYRNCSDQLDDIASSLVKLDVLVFYETQTFRLRDSITLERVRASKRVEALGGNPDIFTESVGGTALSIYNNDGRIAFLSCAHIVNYPDTVVNYFSYPDEQYVEVIGIKARQQNNISTLQEGSNLDILALDPRTDIVLLGKETGEQFNEEIHVIDYPMGRSIELEWGSFVYIMGFPLGHAMITRGIVSDPDRIAKGSFLIDAVFNQGFSGGPVIAVRDGVPNFEIVGMVRSSAATNHHFLVPVSGNEIPEVDFEEPYDGELKLVSRKDIKYGITFSITTGALRKFYKENRNELLGKGYVLDNFFNQGD